MKRGWKIFWIICACLAGLGLVLCIVGFALGATFAGVEQAFWEYGHRSVASVEQIEEYLDENIDDIENEDSWEDGSGSAATVSDSFRASLSGIKELNVDVTYLQVEIQESTDDEIILFTNNIPAKVKDELILTQDEDELEITIRNQKNWSRVMNNLGKPASLTIQIPKEHNIHTMSLTIGAGVLEAERIQVGELEVEVGAGQANIQQFTADSLDVKVGAGEADIAGTVTAEADIECGIGEVNFQASGSQADYSYDVEVGAGEVSIGNEEYSGLMNRKQITNGGPLMEIKCGIGEVNVTFEE